MNRRSFLTSLGLGGLALTTPKPLEILASVPAGEAPPLHVGVATLPESPGMRLHDMGIMVPEGTYDLAEFLRVMAEWKLTVVSRPPQDLHFNILMEKPAAHCVRVRGVAGYEPVRGGERGYVDNIAKGHTVQMWMSPVGKPTRALPKIQALFDASHGAGPMDAWMHLRIGLRRAQLDHTRAVELGLVPESDPYENV